MSGQVSNALRVCQEAIAVLIAKELDEKLLGLLGAKLCDQLKEVLKLVQDEKTLDAAVESEVESALSAFYGLHSTYFLGLGTGLLSPIVHSLLLTLNVTSMLSEKYEQVQAYLVNSGHLVQNFFEMEEMKKTLSGDSVASNFIALNLMILYSCSVQSGFHYYFRHYDLVSFFGPYCKSPQFVIKYHSMVVAGRVSAHLPFVDTAILQLEDSDVEVVVNLLSTASASDKHEVKGHQCVFSTTELLSGVNCLLIDSMNAKKLIKSDILTILISILVTGYPDEQKQVVLILWSLVDHLPLMEAVGALDLPLTDVLYELESSEETDLKLVTSGLLSCIDAGSKPNPEACYTYHHYDKCSMQCDIILSPESKFDSPHEVVKLYKGKSLYKLFRRQQSILRHSILDDKHFNMQLDTTYSMAREAIQIFDKVVLDEEGSQMFDLAMMEYASETNRLGEIKRCLLCRLKAKLLRSHICPHSILREFCSGLTVPESLRVFDTTSAKVGHSKSPKEATTFAFCKSCENAFSLNGEQDFIPNFFRKIYSRSNLMVQSEGVSIPYKSWLYNFCVGMLFHALIKQEINKYNNCEELYSFFLQCRSILLNPSLQNLDSADLPDVYVLIGPHKARDKDKEYGFVNQVLNDASFNVLWTSSKPPYSAHFIVVHVGVIYIIKHFSSSTHKCPPDCKINPGCGVYLVPPEQNRCQYFTEEWWDVVRAVAIERSNAWLQRPLAPLTKMLQTKMMSPAPSLDSLFHVSSSVHADLEVFQESIVPSPDPNKPRIVSLLPAGFGFRPASDPTNIVLPKEHQILLHYSVNDKECYFIAVGNSESYDTTNPYVIYSHCEPGLQVSMGFFIDPTTLKFVDFLPLREGKAMLERLAVVDRLKEEIGDTMIKCLKAKGIQCLDDVLHLLRLDTTKFSIDTKCFGAYCWYCIDKCCFCLKPSGSNYSTATSGKIWRYCSSECMKSLNEASPLKLTVTKPVSEPMSSGALKVSIQGSGMLSDDEPPAVVATSFLMYLEKTEAEVFPASLFYSSRSHHLQNFCYCNSVSSLSEVLAVLEKSTGDHEPIKCVLSLLLNSFQQHQTSVASSSDFYCALAKCSDVENPPLSVVGSVYPMLLPVLKMSILDFKVALQKSTLNEGKPQASFVTEYQFLKLQEIAPPECALSIEFSHEVKSTQFSVCEPVLNMSFCSVMRQVGLILISRINALFEETIKDDNKSNESFYGKLTQLYGKFEECLVKMPVLMKQDICDKAGEANFFIKKLKKLTDVLYVGLNQGLSTEASKCLLSTLSIVASLCPVATSSKFREAILSQTDYVSQLSCQLRELKYIKEIDQFIIALIVATLNVVRGMCWEFKYYWQIKETKLPETILVYCDSPLVEVAIAARMCLCPLFCILDPKLMKHMALTELMASTISLNETERSISKVLVQNKFQDLLSLLVYISSLMDRDISVSSMIYNPELLSVILRLASSTLQLPEYYELEMETTLSFIFKLTLANKSLLFEEDELVAQLLSLTGSPLASLQVMASCILWKLNDEPLLDIPYQYIHQCYTRKCYTECLFICEELLKTGGNSVHANCDDILLMKGKVLFHSFMNEFVVLKQQKGHLQEKVFRTRHSDCFANARQAIDIFGILLDSGFLEGDPEGSQFLDLSMIHLAYETNDLRSCKRCLLCRKIAKLHRSHIWPRAILQDFSSDLELPKSKRTLLVSWKSHERYSSAKEVTFFLFCGSCENLLSGHGESQFVPHFFRKVQNLSCDSQGIEYGSWLYEFCIGIIFRGLLQPSIMKFVNCDETFSMLTFCREFLLKLIVSDRPITNCDSIPDVHIVLNQVESDDDPSKYIHRLLNLLAFYGVEEISLADGSVTRPRTAQYFIAHFGIVNIIMKFKASKYEFNPATKINFSGGIFSILDSSQRQHLIPPGIWSEFIRLVDFQANKEDQPVCKENVDILGAVDRDLSSMLLQLKLSASSPKLVSFLPRDFVVVRSDVQSCVELPTGHRLLLHYLITLKGCEETMFLCIGNGGNYSLQKPYVIYHLFKAGFQLTMAFFISANDLTAQEFLPETHNLIELKKMTPVSVFRQYIHKLLPTILLEKGFHSFRSLLYRIHDCNNGSVDLRCQSLSRCWYCLDRCDFCMEVVPFGCTRATVESFNTQFCASCQDVSRVKESLEAKVSPISPNDLPLPMAISPLSLSHKPLVRICCVATIERKPFVMEFVLCTSSKSDDMPTTLPYVVYHHWNLLSQQFLEFTVTPEMNPAEPVVYTEGDNSRMAVTKLREMPIQRILLQAIEAYKIIVA